MYHYVRKISVVFLLMILVSSTIAQPSSAAIPSLEKIRVALFLNAPDKQFTSKTALSTLSSPDGLEVVITDQQWLTIAAGTEVMFSPNDYKVKVYESTSFDQSLKVHNALKSAGGAPFLTSLNKNNSVTFQVLEGSYGTRDEAVKASAKWNQTSSVSTLIKGFTTTLIGPLMLENAGHSSKQAALTAAAIYGAQGIDTAIGLKMSSDGKLTYSVMLGFATSAAELELVKAAAGKVTGTIAAVDSQDDYLVLRNNHSTTGKASSFHELYQFGTGNVVTVSSIGDTVVTLKERSERSYRGALELSYYNQAMAVVNELPFEQYLYSVVAIEMYPSWPMEALKAQAVAARSYALNKGYSFHIAHVVDTTLSQAYYGYNSEHPNTTAAVNATAGEVALYNGKVIEALFSANAGGYTADAEEIWGNSVAYLKAAPSLDSIAEKGKLHWYRVVLPNGSVGYIREDLVQDTGRVNDAGQKLLTSNTDGTNIRRNPLIQSNVPVVATINKGVQLVAIDKVIESNSFSWRRGPYSGEELLAVIQKNSNTSKSGKLSSLEVTKRGTSNRVLEIQGNGKTIITTYPVSYRTILGVDGSLPSTKFNIEQTGTVVMVGAGGNKVTKEGGAGSIPIMGASGTTSSMNGQYLFVLDGAGNMRAATKEAGYQFDGTGNGHGVGLSQYGAYSLAEQGYDYQTILKYYYNGITIAKD